MVPRNLRKLPPFLVFAIVTALNWGCTAARHTDLGPAPLELLKSREWEKRESSGRVYLGRILKIPYEHGSMEMPDAAHPYVLELTDVIKTPLRSNYHLLLRGLWRPGGDREANRVLSEKQVRELEQTLIQRYYMDKARINVEVAGPVDPGRAEDTAWLRSESHWVEVHVFGDVSKAVRFVNPQEEAQ